MEDIQRDPQSKLKIADVSSFPGRLADFGKFYLIFCVFFVSKCKLLDSLFFFTSVDVCHMEAVKRLPVLHYSADYILIYFLDIETILVTLKIKYRFSRC